uniref:Uncharacterized protein n=1 Tax=Arundo donax TaxID=35708 RepID=A0A0A9ESI0_ARUDO
MLVAISMCIKNLVELFMLCCSFGSSLVHIDHNVTCSNDHLPLLHHLEWDHFRCFKILEVYF